MRFDKLAERQILKAQAEGQFDNLKGEGKPLPLHEGGDYAQAAGYRMMAEAGALPLELELRKAVAEQTRLLQQASDPAEQRALMQKLADLQMRLAIQEEARRRFGL